MYRGSKFKIEKELKIKKESEIEKKKSEQLFEIYNGLISSLIFLVLISSVKDTDSVSRTQPS